MCCTCLFQTLSLFLRYYAYLWGNSTLKLFIIASLRTHYLINFLQVFDFFSFQFSHTRNGYRIDTISVAAELHSKPNQMHWINSPLLTYSTQIKDLNQLNKNMIVTFTLKIFFEKKNPNVCLLLLLLEHKHHYLQRGKNYLQLAFTHLTIWEHFFCAMLYVSFISYCNGYLLFRVYFIFIPLIRDFKGALFAIRN